MVNLSETKAKKKNLRGFAALIANRMEPLRDNEDFKIFSKDLNMKVLLNATDAKYAALISVKNGTFTVDGIPNDDKNALKKKALGWNGKLATTSLIFFEMATRKFTQGEMLKYIVIIYILIFGIANMIYGERLYSERKKKGIQIGAIITLVTGFVFAVILTFIFPNPKFVVYVILLIILIAIRIFYFYEKWTSGMLKSY